MNDLHTPQAQARLLEARQSYTGKTLTDAQFEESSNLAGIMERSIRKSGSFNDKLKKYSKAFSDTEKFDQMKGETIIRDIFTAQHGQTMNQMREEFAERASNLPENAKELALKHAKRIVPSIRDGKTMPFYQAFDQEGLELVKSLKVTETVAKNLMKSTFYEKEGRELYDAGKEAEETYYKPVVEAERAERQASRAKTASRSPVRSM